MLYSFLKMNVNNDGEISKAKNAHIFQGGQIGEKVYKKLKIAQLTKVFDDNFAKWPVIFLNFKGISNI